MKITASQAKKFVLCPRIVYLDKHGPRERKLPPPEFLLRKAEEGVEFEEKIASSIPHKSPVCKKRDWACFIAETKKLMEKGTGVIYQGVLSSGELFGIPDFLEKKKGKSRLGDFYYTVSDVKSGLSVKEKYLAQVMFYAYLVSKVQGFMPPKAYVILGDETRGEIDTKKHLEKFRENLAEIREIVKGKEIPPSRVTECPNCPWYDVCFEILLKKKDISLLYKLTKSAKQKLENCGIRGLAGVMGMDTKKLSESLGIREVQLKKWKSQAKSWIENRPIVTGKIEFPKVKTEIFLDFESEDQTHYLIGLLVRNGNEKTMQFVAHKRKDEKKAWKEFVDFLSKQDDFVIYHYGAYEKKAFRQLIERHGIPKQLEKKLFDSLFDLLKMFYEKVMLPTWSYSLKPVAKYIGFKWRSEGAGGDISMIWYDSYIKTGDKKFINMLKEYNEDDLIATKMVKDWICRIASEQDVE